MNHTVFGYVFCKVFHKDSRAWISLHPKQFGLVGGFNPSEKY